MFLYGGILTVLDSHVDKLLAERGPQSKSPFRNNERIRSTDIWRHLHPKEKDFTFMSHVHAGLDILEQTSFVHLGQIYIMSNNVI